MARRSARLVAQAKINLLLHVLARESNGYHQIETIFQRLDLGDEVSVHVGTNGRAIDCRGADCGPPERNLAFRAAVAYLEAADWRTGFAIEIEKRIPVGGGLGGGSADAGAVLRALDALAPRSIGAARLLHIAATLGSDVPFLTAITPLALAWGRGERMLALAPLPARPVLLALFDQGVATADAYRWLDEPRGDAAIAPRLLPADAAANWGSVASFAANDFETVVLQRRPDIALVLAHLSGSGSIVARMSGSGATVFAILDRAHGSVAGSDRGAAPGWRPLLTETAVGVVPVEVLE